MNRQSGGDRRKPTLLNNRAAGGIRHHFVPPHRQGWLRGHVTCAVTPSLTLRKGLALGSTICCCHLEICSKVFTRGPGFHCVKILSMAFQINKGAQGGESLQTVTLFIHCRRRTKYLVHTGGLGFPPHTHSAVSLCSGQELPTLAPHTLCCHRLSHSGFHVGLCPRRVGHSPAWAWCLLMGLQLQGTENSGNDDDSQSCLFCL